MKPIKQSGLHYFVVWENAHASGSLDHDPILDFNVAEALGQAWLNSMIECDDDPEAARQEYDFEILTRHAHTLAEWNVKGYLVREGEKAAGHDISGHALFLDGQVTAMREKPPEAPENPFSF